MWTEDLPLKFIKKQTTLCHDETATNWGNMLRELCSQDLIANFRQLGGFEDNKAATKLMNLCISIRNIIEGPTGKAIGCSAP